jgi:tetratricopeptide (TPR) repeat protein
MGQKPMRIRVSASLRRAHALTALGVASLALGSLLSPPAWSQQAAAPAASAASAPQVRNSALDGQLLYEMLVGEMALNDDDAGSAYQLILDAARRSGDDGLFRHAVQIALKHQAGDQALAAARAWRTAKPQAAEPVRLELQVLVLLNRSEAIGEPLKALLELTPAPERPHVIDSIPLLMQRATNPAAVATVIEATLQSYLEGPTGVAARVAIGRSWLAAHQPDRALEQAKQAQDFDPSAPAPALLALQLMHERPAAEQIATAYLARSDAVPAIRLGYVRALTAAQRYADAIAQLQIVIARAPDSAPPYLTLGALQLELRHAAEGESALLHYIELVRGDAAKASAAASAAASASDTAESNQEGADIDRNDSGLTQAWLMLAQSAEDRGDYAGAESWLDKVTDPKQRLEVQTRRASILAHQGKIDEARALIRAVPEQGPDDARAKLLAEARVLRDVKRWSDAFDVLADANQRYADDTDLLYEQAMMAEKLNRIEEMERLLRRVIELDPNNAQARNALGYTLADRKMRLPEALQLIKRALELTPGDPFITDSLGWVEYRMGHREESLKLLREAYAARPDPEIAAHLGEVLWSLGMRDEARRVWGEAKVRDSDNDVLRETLVRLRVSL